MFVVVVEAIWSPLWCENEQVNRQPKKKCRYQWRTSLNFIFCEVCCFSFYYYFFIEKNISNLAVATSVLIFIFTTDFFFLLKKKNNNNNSTKKMFYSKSNAKYIWWINPIKNILSPNKPHQYFFIFSQWKNIKTIVTMPIKWKIESKQKFFHLNFRNGSLLINTYSSKMQCEALILSLIYVVEKGNDIVTRRDAFTSFQLFACIENHIRLGS